MSPIDVAHVIAKEDLAVLTTIPSAKLMIRWLPFMIEECSISQSDQQRMLLGFARCVIETLINTSIPAFFSPIGSPLLYKVWGGQLSQRQNDAENGISTPRECPTAEMYHAYQVAQGVVSSDTRGGLYRRIMLKAVSASDGSGPDIDKERIILLLPTTPGFNTSNIMLLCLGHDMS